MSVTGADVLVYVVCVILKGNYFKEYLKKKLVPIVPTDFMSGKILTFAVSLRRRKRRRKRRSSSIGRQYVRYQRQ